MPALDIDGLIFTFPNPWSVTKYDEWSFYRNQFSRQGGGIKAVDAIALDPNGTAYLIEVKDYRHPETEKPSQLPAAIAGKVLHTLSAMLPAKLLATDPGEASLAGDVLTCASLRIVAHIEQPQRHRGVVDPADLRQKLRELLRAVDPHVKVVSMTRMQALPWTVH